MPSSSAKCSAASVGPNLSPSEPEYFFLIKFSARRRSFSGLLRFDGVAITSDGGGLLLREVEKRIGILCQFAACFTDYRNPDLIEHRVEEMVAQRVYGLALGYEDLNDHEELGNDPLLEVLVEKADRGSQVLAGKSTLNRLELTQETASRKERYKKIVLDHGVSGQAAKLFLK